MEWRPTTLTPDTFQRLQWETMNDRVLKAFYQMVIRGWPPDGSAVSGELKPYWSFREEISTYDGVLVKSPQNAKKNPSSTTRTGQRYPKSKTGYVLPRNASSHSAYMLSMWHLCPVFGPKTCKVFGMTWDTCTAMAFILMEKLQEFVTINHYSDFFELD